MGKSTVKKNTYYNYRGIRDPSINNKGENMLGYIIIVSLLYYFKWFSNYERERRLNGFFNNNTMFYFGC